MRNVQVDELKIKIDSGEKITIIDVRMPVEVARGKIENSINLPLDFFESEIEGKVKDKNAGVYLYCLSGGRSIIAAQIMERKGYKNVFNVISGLLAWRSKGYPLV
ncbi:MAG: rhodanese-like domain-containing protein [Candidatus Levybacteria bacterium]|nr:rhodanese-like domain-containing protein [Candidatus Levybacteria bacterium]